MERHILRRMDYIPVDVSIHAPVMERRRRIPRMPQPRRVSIHAPVMERHTVLDDGGASNGFQFTLL